ncbi:MAG: hypothetical protein LBG80_04255 [Bacteroidales bacterium]|jgi:uncharacterized protein YPO0396|nr:hypothetical protein [Bacteroidales bacterium]
MNELESNIDNTQIGFRLDYMELLNWGTFHNKIWSISPKGKNSLLTGAIGSGKSTIVDALTCLFVPYQKITFNKAAGAEGKERTLASYIRGEYKNTKNELSELKGKAISLRYNDTSDTTFTVILANFHNVGYSSNITLAQALWIENDKVQKLFIISTRALTIKNTFENIEDGKTLKKRIERLSQIEYIGDKFSEYSQKFRRLFGMNSEKAIDLFYQTISMKSVSSLTSFVREQMLEQTDIKSQIENLKNNFNDLNKAYDAVKEARKQKEILFPLVALNKCYTEYRQQIEEIDNIVSAIPSYFADKKINLLKKEIETSETTLNEINNQLNKITVDLDTKRKAKSQIEQDIDSNGGTRLKEIANEIQNRISAKTEKQGRYNEYDKLLSICELPVANTDNTFYANLKTAQQKLETIKDVHDKKTRQWGEKTADLRIIKEKVEATEAELQSLRSRKNQIPLSLLDVRQRMIDDLQIPENEIPFVGELIRVKDEERSWEGALERLLHGFGISLLVSEKYYGKVSGYINATRLSDKNERGVRLDYFLVPLHFNKTQYTGIDADSAVNKIEIKSDSYFEEWLQLNLEQHFNLKCVTIEEFKQVRQDAITMEGLYKKGKKHTKDDRKNLWDRRNFVLGWTNQKKIKAVELDLTALNQKQQSINTELEVLEREIEKCVMLNTKLNLVTAYKNWNDLNWQDEAKQIEALKQESAKIETSNNVLKSLQDSLRKVEIEISQLDDEKQSKNKIIGGIETNIQNYKEEIITCQSTKNTIFQKEIELYYPKIDKLIEQFTITFQNINTINNKLRDRYMEKDGERDKLNSKLQKTRDDITRTMMEYKKEFPADMLELSVEIDALPEFIEKYEEITNEGLPEHEMRFKEMLNRNTIEDIRIFDVKLSIHRGQIKNKIDEINKHLKEIEFNTGTYIELSSDNNADKEIIDFRSDLRECYANILDTSDAYTENRFNMVKKFLDRFMSNESKEIEWTKKVTDVRNWFLFSASERYFEDDTEKEYYSDTAGKSGGQKEKLAYTILASALAYQFGLSYDEPRSKSFRFVVIDEAFGRGDDESTQFGLELFKKLNLQLLVITPFQKIHIIENYINSVHVVSNIGGNHSEVQYLTTDEYREEKQRRNNIQIIEENNL